MTDPLVALSHVSVTHAGADRPAIRDVSFTIARGEVVLLAGPSGSGKSTLALATNGLIPHAVDAAVTGSVTVGGMATSDEPPARLGAHVGMVFQDPDAQVVTGSVRDEVAFALENLRLTVAEIESRAKEALGRVGLWERRDEDPSALSGGGRQRLAIACALAMRPALIVLDEPTANLDPDGVAEVYTALRELVADGERSILLVEHDLAAALPLATRVLVLDHDGSLAVDGPPDEVLPDRSDALRALGVVVPELASRGRRDAGPGADPIVTARDIAVTRGGRDVLSGVSVDIPRGSFTAVVGPNGAGKTTLAQALAGVIPVSRGEVRVDGADPWRARRRGRHVRFVFQNPEHQFVAHTVRDELAHDLRPLRLPAAAVDDRVSHMLDRIGLTAYAEQHPSRLSGGQKRRLSVGTALIAMPPGGVLVLDEPLYGQDAIRAEALTTMLEDLHQEGTTIVVVTHDRRLVERHATHVIEMAAPDPDADASVATVRGPGGAPAPMASRSGAMPRRRRYALDALNPLATFAAVIPAMIGLVLTRDALTPAIFLALAYVALLAGTRLTRRIALWLGVTLPAIVVILAAGFGLWSGLEAGIATALRLAALLALALVPGMTSDGVDTVRAFVAQLRIPYRIGYAALAALRFVPRFRYELDVIRSARRVRGSAARGPIAAVGLLVPLLASGIRHAERVALAMDARAFGAHPTRTERRVIRWRPRDTACVVGAWILTAAGFVIPAVADQGMSLFR
ncbi:ATP-binding cassette domain-containing protein [Microbacterium karelineae]|uniref:ATP-binding cassette domain-containing protein n=1 Tax=Microbacterium karelineae TaxID=2654283 RepID=UPI0012EA2A7E|nr:ATP-binding cassette domain-containing protein [Microbacterium karelineae]